MEVSSKIENKVEENLFTINDKWVTNERSRRKCKRSNTEKVKLNGTGISEYGNEKSGMVKNNVGNFNSTLNLNFSSIMSNLLEEELRNSYKTSVSSNSSQFVCPNISKDVLNSQD